MAQRIRPITTRARLDALTPRQHATYRKNLHALRLMQNGGLSRPAAAREAGATPASMQRYLGDAIAKRGSARGKRGGRYRATPSARHRLKLHYTLPTTSGVRRLTVSKPAEYELARSYRFALRAYISQGDPSLLAPFKGQSSDGWTLETEPGEIDVMVGSGELDPDDIGS